MTDDSNYPQAFASVSIARPEVDRPYWLDYLLKLGESGYTIHLSINDETWSISVSDGVNVKHLDYVPKILTMAAIPPESLLLSTTQYLVDLVDAGDE